MCTLIYTCMGASKINQNVHEAFEDENEIGSPLLDSCGM